MTKTYRVSYYRSVSQPLGVTNVASNDEANEMVSGFLAAQHRHGALGAFVTVLNETTGRETKVRIGLDGRRKIHVREGAL